MVRTITIYRRIPTSHEHQHEPSKRETTSPLPPTQTEQRQPLHPRRSHHHRPPLYRNSLHRPSTSPVTGQLSGSFILPRFALLFCFRRWFHVQGPFFYREWTRHLAAVLGGMCVPRAKGDFLHRSLGGGGRVGGRAGGMPKSYHGSSDEDGDNQLISSDHQRESLPNI